MSAFQNLERNTKTVRLEKYKASQEAASQWLTKTLQMEPSLRDLMDLLHDGVLLCKLGELVQPGGPTARARPLKMPFVCMENILFFLQACADLGVPADETFQTVDLFEQQDPYQVVVTLMAFSRAAQRKQPGKVEVLELRGI